MRQGRLAGALLALALIVSLAAALVPSSRGAAAQQGKQGSHGSRLKALDPHVVSTQPVEDGVAVGPSSRRLQAVASWGGVYQDAQGEQIMIQVSDSYPQDPARAQKWADFLGALIHGPELELLHVYVATPAEIGTLCQSADAAGCYQAASETMYVPGEDDAATGVPAESIVRHEYGHHVARNRLNPPWTALDYGSKRWASYERVCQRVAAGQAYPGDEGDDYRLNPGEAFAEDYRLLNERAQGLAELPWLVVDPVFYPAQGTLDALQADVLTPWTHPTVHRFSGRLSAAHPRLAWRLPLQLDGALAVYLRGPAQAQLSWALDGQRQGGGQGRRVLLRGLDCGAGQLELTVSAHGHYGLATAAVTAP